MSCKVRDSQHRQPLLVQGGLETPMLITLEMDMNAKNSAIVDKYEALFKEYYQESVNGEYDDATSAILKALNSGEDVDSSSSEDEDE